MNERIGMDYPDDEKTKRNVIVAIDVGSSSIRCTAYDCSSSTSTVSITSQQQLQLPSYTILASYSSPRKSIETYTGHIRIVDIASSNTLPSSDSSNAITNDLFDCIDTCVDQVLDQLQQTNDDRYPYSVVGIGFTTFVMNLIGVDHDGKPIGNDISMSYACQTTQVQDEVQQLQR
jgi:sugar (pentulose or hexulose) kinase